MSFADEDQDGIINRAVASKKPSISAIFDELDENNDGKIGEAEYRER